MQTAVHAYVNDRLNAISTYADETNSVLNRVSELIDALEMRLSGLEHVRFQSENALVRVHEMEERLMRILEHGPDNSTGQDPGPPPPSREAQAKYAAQPTPNKAPSPKYTAPKKRR